MEFFTKKTSKTPSETTKTTTSSHISPTKVRDYIPKAVKIPKNKSSTPEFIFLRSMLLALVVAKTAIILLHLRETHFVITHRHFKNAKFGIKRWNITDKLRRRKEADNDVINTLFTVTLNETNDYEMWDIDFSKGRKALKDAEGKRSCPEPSKPHWNYGRCEIMAKLFVQKKNKKIKKN